MAGFCRVELRGGRWDGRTVTDRLQTLALFGETGDSRAWRVIEDRLHPQTPTAELITAILNTDLAGDNSPRFQASLEALVQNRELELPVRAYAARRLIEWKATNVVAGQFMRAELIPELSARRTRGDLEESHLTDLQRQALRHILDQAARESGER